MLGVAQGKPAQFQLTDKVTHAKISDSVRLPYPFFFLLCHGTVGSRIPGTEVRMHMAECPGEKRVIKTVIEKLLSKRLFCREEVH